MRRKRRRRKKWMKGEKQEAFDVWKRYLKRE